MSKEKLTKLELNFWNLAYRFLWNIVWVVFFRISPTHPHCWRVFLLRLFGARIGAGSHVYSSARIWDPRNLTMGKGSCIGPCVDVYNPAMVTLGDHVTVSQSVFLCTASHDVHSISLPLVVAPIELRNYSWIFSRAMIGPGVTVGVGSIVGLGSLVVRDLEEWVIYGGNPARKIGDRDAGIFSGVSKS